MVSVPNTPKVVRANRRHKDDGDRRLAHHGWFYSPKNDAMLPYRGTLAFDFLNLAETHPDVISIANRPQAYTWWNGAAWETYRARYMLVMRTEVRGVTRVVDVEVLPSRELVKDAVKYDRIRREAERESRTFKVFTEKDIRIEPRLENAKAILVHGGERAVSEADRNLIRQVAYGTVTFTLNQLVSIGVLPYDRACAAVLNLVAAGELSFRLDRKFDGDSAVGRGRPNG